MIDHSVKSTNGKAPLSICTRDNVDNSAEYFVPGFLKKINKDSSISENFTTSSEKNVILIMCEAAKDKDAFAYALSKALPKCNIIAATGKVHLSYNSNYFSYSADGNWVEIKNGEMIPSKTQSGDTVSKSVSE